MELLKKWRLLFRQIVARKMKENNLFARRKRNFKFTIGSVQDYPITVNILNQGFAVLRENQV